MARTQRYSAYAFLTFLGIHGSTAVLSPLFLGVDSGNASLLLARTYFYQASPYTELLLIPGSLLLHVGSGLGLRLHRHFEQRERYGGKTPGSLSQWRWGNLSGITRTGLIALPTLALHTAVMRIVPYLVDGDSAQVALEYLAYGFHHSTWGRLVSGAFYTGFVGAVSYHVCFGLAQFLKVQRTRRTRRTVNAVAVGTTALWLGGVSRIVYESGKAGGYIGRHYEHFYKVFFRRV